MTGNVEHYAAFTCILLTFALTINQGHSQKRTCSLFSRPHPNGLCGQKLAQAHENICFLIRQNYPQFFPLTKRPEISETADLDEDQMGPQLRDFDDSDSGLGSGLDYMGDIPYHLTRMGKDVTTLKSAEKSDNIPEDVTDSAFLYLLAKRSPQTKRSLVCDCCYGPCSTRTLVRYC